MTSRRKGLPPALPPGLRRFLELFCAAVDDVLGSNLVGIYLLGSVVSTDFQPRSSDIDFLVVTRRPLTRREGTMVQAVHRRLARAGRWGARLEGGYAARGRLRPWGIIGRVPSVEGSRVSLTAPNDWTAENIMAVREHGITLAGPAPAGVLPAVDQRTLRRALDRYLRELVRHRPRSPEDAAGVALDIARCLYSADAGRPSWKNEAAGWLARQVPSLGPILAAAMAVHRDGGRPAERRLVRERLAELQRSASGRRGIMRRGSSGR